MTLADLMKKLPEFITPDKVLNTKAVVQFEFTGKEAGEWYANIDSQGCTVAQGVHSSPDLALKADSEDFLQIASGQADAMQAFMLGKVRIDGNMGLAAKLLQAFKLQ
jgi:putative sterol carrier protein